MVKVKPRHRKKYIILPVSLLVFNVLQELVVYKAELFPNPQLRTLFLMIMFTAGFALVSFIVAPAVERAIEKLVLSGKKGAGLAGELFITLLFFAGLFYLYLQIYTHPAGIESILPKILHNHSR